MASLFNNKNISALHIGTVLGDDIVLGLQVRANVKRTSFYLYYRTKAGVERRPKIGDCAVLKIPEARDIARGILLTVAQGLDPGTQKAKAREDPTMAVLWQLCAKDLWNRGTQWDKEVKRLYDNHIRPVIGTLKVVNVKYADVVKVHKSLESTPNQANRVTSVLSKMLNHAERLEFRPIGSNPCVRIQRFRELKRKRYATPKELAGIGMQLYTEATAALVGECPGVAFLYLLMFTGARPSEIARARWDQLNGNVLRIDDGKTGQRTVFLPPQAMRVIDKLPRDRSTITGLKAVPKALWKRVREAAGCPDLWARDSRRTFATVGLSNGISAGMVGELLGHQSAQTTKTYAKLMEAPAVKASTSIANKIEEMLGDKINPSV